MLSWRRKLLSLSAERGEGAHTHRLFACSSPRTVRARRRRRRRHGKRDERRRSDSLRTVQPEIIASPTLVLPQQKGNCFEFSIVLCSLLIGVGYDAFVVSGYATYELCSADQTRLRNPELHKYAVVRKEEVPVKKKYEMNVTKEFLSQYLITMQQRAEAEAKAREEAERLRVEEEMLPDYSDLPPDELFSVRVHSWVMIRPGALGVEEIIFIDPPTGNSYSQDEANFLGIESVWNHTNYWVNLQDCTEGCKNLNFDLKNPTCWIWLLLAEPSYMRTDFPEDEKDEGEDYDEDDEEAEQLRKEKRNLIKSLVEQHMDMPASWVPRLTIPRDVFKRRYPNGAKQILYFRSKVEYYAPYVQRDGLLMRVTTYSDNNYEQKLYVYETYGNRADFLTDVTQDFKTESVVAKFARGREEGLREHSYFLGLSSMEDKRTVEFYSQSRADCLGKLEMDPLFLDLYYENRIDRLSYRHVNFLARTKGSSFEEKRSIVSLLEKYNRNYEVDNEEDIAERLYLPLENKIVLKFHYGENKVIASTREFIKPPPEKMGDKLVYDPTMTSGFNVDPTFPAPKPHVLYELLRDQLIAEEQAFYDIRMIQDELSILLKQRHVETVVPKLTTSVYDTERNVGAQVDMADKDKKLLQEEDKEVDFSIDHIAPYIARYGSIVTKEDALLIYNTCIADFKATMVARANRVQEVFEKTARELKVRHEQFELERESLTKEQEDEYYEQCGELRFYLHTLELRLKRHKELTPIRYKALEDVLKKDSRLAILFAE